MDSISMATVTIHVGSVNDPPVVDSPIADQANSDSEFISLDVSGNFSDVEGDSLTFGATGLPAGLSLDPSTGLISGTLDSSASASGPYTVVITADDGNGGTVTDTFTWSVANPGPTAGNDSFSTSEDTPLSGSVAGNDSDSDGDVLTFNALSSPSKGSIVFNPDGSFTYSPDADYFGTDSFDYELVDADGSISMATVTIHVGSVNDPPVVDSPIADQANSDSEFISLDVSGNFSDVEGDSLTFSATGLPTGLSIDPSTGLISGTLDSSASAGGPYTVVITADDGNGGTVTDTFTWNVANPGPMAGNDSFSTSEDTPLSGSVAGNDSDADGDVLTFNALTSPVNGSLVFNPDGSFTYTPDSDFHGSDSFDYQIVDADGSTSTATVTINVVSVNDPPVVDSPIADQANSDSELISLDVSGNFRDLEGDSLTFGAAGLPAGLSLDPSTGLISGTLDSSASASGPYTVVITADDGNGGTVTDTFTWSVANPGPTAGDDSFSTSEDTPFGGSVAGNDTDSDGDVLTFNALTSPSNGSLVFNPDGSFTYSPDAGYFGTDSFDYEMVDADGSTSIATVTIHVGSVNDPPVVDSPIADQSNSDSEVISLDVSGNFSDVEGDSLTFGATGLPAGLSLDASSGLISGILDSSASASGPYTVVITADDGNGGTVTDTFTWSVANPGPMAGNDSFSTSEDTPLSGSVAGNDSDADGDVLTFNALTSPSNGSLVFNPDGSFTYSPDADYFGTDSFDYELVDADGSTSTATVTINVVSVNDPPVVDSPIPDQANSDSEVISLDVSGNFSDLEGDSLTFSATGLPVGLSIDGASGLISGTLDSSASASGPYTVVITADDGNGGTVTDTFTWAVTNPGPTAGGDSFSTSEDTPLSGSVAGNDSDADGDALTFNALSSPSKGSIVFNPDGSFTYTPDSDFHGSDSFDYEIVDADGSISMATVTINVGSVNDPPVVDSPIADQANSDSEVISLDVSGNFSDLEGDSLTFGATGLPAGLSLDPSTGLISGTLDSSASASGPYTVVITADDGNGGTVTDTFTWSVANPGPTAGNDSFSTSEDTLLSGSVAGNDSDADGDALTFSTLSSPANGSLVVNPDGSFTYAPNQDFFGTDSFDYQVVDADGSTSTATVTISVVSVNDPPVVDSPIADQANSDSEVISLDVSGNFSDVEGDSLTFSATGLPAGLSLDPSTGLISGTLDSSASASGPYAVVITADDGNGGTVTDTFTWSVANPGPTAGNDSFSTSEDTPLSGNVAGNDSDADGDALTFNALSSPANGSLVFNPDGSFTYTPDSDFHGSDSFDYEIVDADGSISMATVTIHVGSVNDPPVVDSPIADQANSDSEFISLDVSGNFSDVEGDSLTFSATGLPTGLSIDPSTGLVSGTLDSSASPGGPYTVVITADDGNGGAVTDTFTWSVANPAPNAVNDVFSTTEDAPFNGDVSSNDADFDGDLISFSKLTDPVNGTVVFNPDGSFDYTPNVNFTGIDSFDYEVVDADGATSLGTVTIVVGDVNDPPVVASPIFDRTSSDDELISLDVSVNFSDVENDPLTFTAIGLPPGLSISPDGLISGTIDNGASQGGPYIVVVTAVDGNGGTATDTFMWAVNNMVPQAANNSTSVSEDSDASGVGNLLSDDDGNGVDSDPDGDEISVVAVNGSDTNVGVAINGTFGRIQILGDGSYVYTIDNNNPAVNGLGNGETLTESFTYTIGDGEGGVSTAMLTVTIVGNNDAPYTAGLLTDQTNLDAEFVSIDVSSLFQDVDSNALIYSSSGLPAGLSLNPFSGMVTGFIDGSASQAGPMGDGIYPVTLTATDDNGETATISFNWFVANPAPVAADDAFSTGEDVAYTGTVALNDVDADGDALTFHLLNGPDNGTVIFHPDGSFSYTPFADYFGSDTFDYEICDADGFCSAATVHVSVVSINDGPVAMNDHFATLEDTPIVGTVGANDSDLEGGALNYQLLTVPANGSLTFNSDGTFTFNPDPNFHGVTTFDYEVCDQLGVCDQATVTIRVDAVNDSPVANDDAVSTDEDSSVTVNLVGNDTDPEGDVPDVVEINGVSLLPGDIITLPSGSQVRLNANGTAEYDPAGHFENLGTGETAVDSFHYTIRDGHGGTAIAEAVITITGQNDAPHAEDDFISTTVNTPVTFDPLPNDSEIENQSLAVVLLNNPPEGTTVVNPDGTITFTPRPGFEGTVTLHYLVEDPEGASDDATITIEVNPEFRFDSFTNFSKTDSVYATADFLEPGPDRNVLSREIFTLAPEPIFSGYARPGTQIVGRIYDSSGALVGEARAGTDPGGNWMMQFHSAKGHDFYRIEFEQITAVAADVYGYLGLNPADNSYQSMEPMTAYDQPLSIEGLANIGDVAAGNAPEQHQAAGFWLGISLGAASFLPVLGGLLQMTAVFMEAIAGE